MLDLIFLAAFAGLLIIAAGYDVATYTIPNWISIALTALFPIAALLGGMALSDIGLHLVFGFAILVVSFFLFQAGVFGGGDAKLLAACAVWTGYIAFPVFIIWTVLAGGALAMLLMTARKYIPSIVPGAPSFVNKLLEPKAGAPYGVAIMCGGLIALQTLPLASRALTLL